MHEFSKRVVIPILLCIMSATSPSHAVVIRGEHLDPNQEFGNDVDYQLTADATFGWRTGTIAGDIDLNGHAFVMDTGGGNRTIFRGAILGQGSFEWIGGSVPQVDASILTGTAPNTFRGKFVLSKGVLDLDKSGGVCAIAGDLVVGSKASAVVRLQQPNQIDDRANVTFGGPETCVLELGGHDERFASLTLQTHAEFILGARPATLVVSEGGPRPWDPTKTLTIRNFKPGRDRIVFGKNERGISKTQVARIGFASPVGLPDGLYTATIGADGALQPAARVSAENPPFDISAAAVAERTKLYEVSGLASLVKERAGLTTDLTIDYFGDSITWQNGFIGLIDKALQADGNGKSIKLINRGINGGGVLQVRDGTKEGAYPGSSPQKSFAEVIAADRADAAVVFIGINDVWWRNTTPADFEQALRDLVASAAAQKTKLVLATLSIHGELPDGTNADDPKIEQFAELTRKVAADTETTLVDLRRAYLAYLQNHNAQLRVDGTIYSKSSGTLTYDGVHPNETGNALLVDLLCDGIVRALRKKSQSTELVPLQPGAAIDYSKLAFQPKSWEQRGLGLQLVPWMGKHVIFLTTDDRLDRQRMALWVSRLDAGWQRYAELTGRRPQPLRQIGGKATIAAVPGADLTCGAGCGYVGATGIELAMFYDRNYPDLQTHPEAMPHYVFYEMGRNFYTFGDRHSCFTTGFAVFMRYVCMDSLKVTDLDAETRRVIESVEPLLATSDLSFLDLFTNVGKNEKAGRIKDRNGKVVSPSDQPVCYASAMLRLRLEHGGDAWVKRFFHELAACPTSDPNTREGALNQSWYWLLSASVAAEKDLSPVFAGEWKLPLAEATRAALGAVDWQKHDLTVQEVSMEVTPEWIDSAEGPQPIRADVPQLIPRPKKLTLRPGSLSLTQTSRILAMGAEVAPLANVLVEEIFLTTGLRLNTTARAPQPGDVVLKLVPGLQGEKYTVDVKETAVVQAGNYAALASGTVTLLQAIRVANEAATIPFMAIEDEPKYPYRGALLDLARKYHSPAGIEQIIELCRFYKIRYLHLHLTDDQLFMFPSAKFTQVGRSNREFARFEPPSKPRIAPYTRAELVALERFALDRGVFLVPELDLPGHSGRLIADAQETFGIPGNGATVNIARPQTVKALTLLLNEVMDVFQSTPYVHLGADEVGLHGLAETPEYQAAQAKYVIRSVHELYCKFIADLHAVVARRGKRAIVWEEAFHPGGPFPLPKEAVVMVWSQGRNPNDIVRAGYDVINAAWTPLYIVRDDKQSPRFLFDWSVLKFGRQGATNYTTLAHDSKLLGAQLCSWENSEGIEVQSLRERLAIVSERSWCTPASQSFAEFQSQFAHTDAVIERLLHSVSIQVQGKLIDNENTFTEPLTISLHAHRPGLTLKYTLDNSLPNDRWQTYLGPFNVDRTVFVRAGLFDDAGRQQGRLVGGWFRSRIPVKVNLATHKPVSVGPSSDRHDAWSAKVAVDGRRDDAGGHWASEGDAPQWLQVDLEKIQPVDFVNVVTYWDGARYYQFTVEISADAKTWKQVLDFSANRKPATADGYSGNFPRIDARYVRINMLKNSANSFVHIVELIVEAQGNAAK